uniref:Pseudouridine synthase n=1 Tax=Mesocestoides corti TaxID=53468 RepID=A0A5K3ES41_MESCO
NFKLESVVHYRQWLKKFVVKLESALTSLKANHQGVKKSPQRSNLTRRDIINASSDGGAFTGYYRENGLRKVIPYYYTFTAFCKRRWVGHRLLTILDNEFNFDEVDFVVQRMIGGQIKVNGEKVPIDYVMKDSDLLEHKLHRHELPILDKPIDIVFEDENILVVNKPSSMPIHPCGQYHHNTLVKVLLNEKSFKNLRVIHRLDRMTSGLVLIGKNYDTAMNISSQISDREVSKFYLAEVEGQFKGPNETHINEASPAAVIVDQPLGRLNAKMGLNAVMPESEGGKPSKTSFVPLLYKKPQTEGDSGRTLVLCRLYTGRTHQVRIHLQYLGFPIVNDPLYNSYDWGETKGAFANYREPRSELLAALAASRDRTAYLKTAVSCFTFTSLQFSFEIFVLTTLPYNAPFGNRCRFQECSVIVTGLLLWIGESVAVGGFISRSFSPSSP